MMRSLNSPGLEVTQLDGQALGRGLMATVQAVMLMKLTFQNGSVTSENLTIHVDSPLVNHIRTHYLIQIFTKVHLTT